jgi:superoxide dismutase, Fe-Mn family
MPNFCDFNNASFPQDLNKSLIQPYIMEQHKVKDFSHLMDDGAIKGLTPKQIEAHLGLYAGYVKKLNEIREKLASMNKQLASDPEVLAKNANFSYGSFSELKRREVVAFNGSYLHQSYFESLEPVNEPDDQFKGELKKAFGSVENWKADIKASAASTPGWVLVAYDKVTQKLNNWVIYEHSVNVPAIAQDVVLALDCWEHAFMIDYGTDKGAYVKAFLENINWEEVNKRLNKVLK